tara:strand:- start:687 stop:1061 length:375 start_codon:yes stop_codon:yes gene_type:complete
MTIKYIKRFTTLIFFLLIYFFPLSISSEEYICSFQTKNNSMSSFQREGDHFIVSGKDVPDLRLNILKETNTFLTLYNSDEIVSFDESILLYILNKTNLTITGWFLQTSSVEEITQRGYCLLSNE